MSKNNQWENKLYFGDNLEILRDKIPGNFVDLIYLDPPFKSGKTYNIIFQPEAGEIKGATAQIQTFEDTWKWGIEAEKNYEGLIRGTITKEKPGQKLIDLMKAMRNYLGEKIPMMAYLSMMAPRLLEMRRVLKNTGSIYLHCDPTASHYLKLLMDSVFGVGNFRNEIVWLYKGRELSHKNYSRKHDIVFFYTKSDNYTFNWEKILEPLEESSRKALARYKDEKGYFIVRYKKGGGFAPIEKEGKDTYRQYVPEGVPPRDWFYADYARKSEQVGYPTQKPEALLERIIKASSNKGDLVLDPFCGCGTTVAVAQKLGRRWMGIDITYLAIDIISKRLKKPIFGKIPIFGIEGEPKDVYSAKKLAQKDPFQFQLWCISKLDATPSQTKSGDEGVDGIINFVDLTKKGKAGKGIIQVKGTENVNPSMVRDLKGTLKSQNADFGILISFRKPTPGMIVEAAKEGYHQFGYTPNNPQYKIPKIQFLTIEDLFKEPLPIIFPPILSTLSSYKKPTIVESKEQSELF